MEQSLGLRVSYTPDIFHRCYNDLLESVSASGLILIRLEFRQVARLRIGAFGNQSTLSIMKEATKQLRGNLHELCIPDLVRRHRPGIPLPQRSAGHRERSPSAPHMALGP